MNPHPEDSLFSKIEKYIPKKPEWLDVDHPDFPKYFSLVIYDEKGNPTTWWERVPEHMKLPPPL